MSDYSISDEILAVNSIYGLDVDGGGSGSEPSSSLSSSSSPLLHPDSSYPNDGSFQILRVPHSAGVELRLHLDPVHYPSSKPPTVVGVVSSGRGTHAVGYGNAVLELVRKLLAERFVPEQPVLFELLQALDERENLTSDDGDTSAGPFNEGQQTAATATVKGSREDAGDKAQEVSPVDVEWVGSEVVTEKKSVFVAHACAIRSAAEAKRNVGMLISSDKKFAKATHNISAFRGHFLPAPRPETGVNGGKEIGDGGHRRLDFQDCDDDGEDAAGGRLLHLLELTGSDNVLVIVSRWYGGVKLGPDRFRIINQVARDALVRGGWIAGSTGSSARGNDNRLNKKGN